MPERVASIIVLAEDLEHVNLVRRFVQRARGRDQEIYALPVPGGHGSGEQFVRAHYAREVRECRQRASRVLTLLIVVTDADKRTVDDRSRSLASELAREGSPARTTEEPIALLIPKPCIEIWIHCLLCHPAKEDDDKPWGRPSPQEIKQAAQTLFQWTRAGAQVPDKCTPSLQASFAEWRRIDTC